MTVPVLLAIDASSSNCSIALQLLDNKTKAAYKSSIIIESTQQQAALLLPSITKLLKNNGLSLSELDGFVLSNGPGRFTGLRISNSCIQGLAYCFDKKIITINSLQLYAQQFVVIHARNFTEANSKTIWVCTKAYSDYYYQAKYTVKQGITYRFVEQTEDKEAYLKHKSEILSELTDNSTNYYYVGTGWYDIWSNNFDKSDSYAEPIDILYCFEVANIEFQHQNLSDVYDVLPLYGSNPYN